MEDENVAQFQALTGSDEKKARQYLQLSENNIEQAVDLFYNTGGEDLLHDAAPTLSASAHGSGAREQPEIVNLDSDEEDVVSKPTTDHSLEDDEAMARRLQEEMYGGRGVDTGPGSGAGDMNQLDAEGYRAPIARTRETLVGGLGADDFNMDDPNDRASAVLAQVRAREQARLARRTRAGIFNQQPGSSIWNDSTADTERRHTRLAAADLSTSSSSRSKATQLAEMYRPPFDLIAPMDWDAARDEGKGELKWLLVNIQDTSIFDCQILNRDLWKDEGIRETIKEHFIFLQYNKDDPAGDRYTNYYFRDRHNQDAYPHVAIVDPRTGEQVKVWSGHPPPKPMEFLMQLHEFLDRYSLEISAKNPVARRKPEERRENKIERMSEEEQLNWALKNSVGGAPAASAAADNDPDALTRSITDLKPNGDDTEMKDGDSEVEVDGDSNEHEPVFKRIASDAPHSEPDSSVPATRIQFRHSGGRVIRRFAVSDPVRRIFEWLKAEPLGDDRIGANFELISSGKNLIEAVDSTIEEAALKNATVMVEYTD